MKLYPNYESQNEKYHDYLRRTIEKMCSNFLIIFLFNSISYNNLSNENKNSLNNLSILSLKLELNFVKSIYN